MKFQRTTLLAICVIALISCSKDEEAAPTVQTSSTLQEFLQTNAPKSAVFEFDAAVGGLFETQNGTLLDIPSNAFLTLDGKPVNGKVQLKIREIFTQTDMVYSGILPASDGTPLNSGGAIYVMAIQNGVQLQLANNASYEIRMPAQALDDEMQLFFGGRIENPAVLNWQLPDTGNRSFFLLTPPDTFKIFSDTLNWINVDVFVTDTLFPIALNVKGIQNPGNNNTAVYCFLNNENSVFRPGFFSPDGFIVQYMVSRMMNIVAISTVNNELYAGKIELRPEEGKTYDIQLAKMSENELKKMLSDLP